MAPYIGKIFIIEEPKTKVFRDSYYRFRQILKEKSLADKLLV